MAHQSHQRLMRLVAQPQFAQTLGLDHLLATLFLLQLFVELVRHLVVAMKSADLGAQYFVG